MYSAYPAAQSAEQAYTHGKNIEMENVTNKLKKGIDKGSSIKRCTHTHTQTHKRKQNWRLNFISRVSFTLSCIFLHRTFSCSLFMTNNYCCIVMREKKMLSFPFQGQWRTLPEGSPALCTDAVLWGRHQASWYELSVAPGRRPPPCDVTEKIWRKGSRAGQRSRSGVVNQSKQYRTMPLHKYCVCLKIHDSDVLQKI